MPSRWLVFFLSWLRGSSSCLLELPLGEPVATTNTKFARMSVTSALKTRISPEQIRAAKAFVCPHGEMFYLKGDPFESDGFKTYHFVSHGNDSTSEAFFTVRSSGSSRSKTGSHNKISAIIVHDSKIENEVIQPMSDLNDKFTHVLLRVGDRKFEDSVEPGSPFDMNSAQEEGEWAANRQSTNAIVYVSVIAYFTMAFKKSSHDARKEVISTLHIANLGYINSNVPVRLRLHCTGIYTGPETPRSKHQLDLFSTHKGSFDLTRQSADVGVLLLDKSLVGAGGVLNGGIAYGNNVTKPFAVLNNQDYRTYYVFGHEIGHIFGCQHDRATLGGVPPYYSYGVGYIIPGTNKHTIMASSGNANNFRINYYSGQKVLDNTGMPTGNTNADNARVLLERRFTLRNIGNEATACVCQDDPMMKVLCDAVDDNCNNQTVAQSCRHTCNSCFL